MKNLEKCTVAQKTLKERLEPIKSLIYSIVHHTVDPEGENCCPYCGHELEEHDSLWQKNKKIGEIYKCPNEYCESEAFNYYFYTTDDCSYLREGYPC